MGGQRMGAEQHITEGNATARPTYGTMNLFHYRPKTAKRLPYYDIFPLTIPVKRHRNGFTGINFHYLSIPQRVKILNILTEAFADRDVEKLDMTWRNIQTYRQTQPMVHRYLASQVDSLFLRLPIEDMLIAVLLPVQRFYKGPWNMRKQVSPLTVHRDSRNIMNAT